MVSKEINIPISMLLHNTIRKWNLNIVLGFIQTIHSTPQKLVSKYGQPRHNWLRKNLSSLDTTATWFLLNSPEATIAAEMKEMEGFTTELWTSLDSTNGKGDLPSDMDNSNFLLEDHGDSDLFNVDKWDLLEKDIEEEDASLLAEVSEFEKEQVNTNIPDITNSDLSKLSDFNKKASDNKISNGSESVKVSYENAQGKRKVKVDWTPDLHRRFVEAVEQLGVDKAAPLRILNLMGVNCLTRHNIASHLQKYRSRRKHLLAREVIASSWSHKRQLHAKGELPPWLTNAGSSLIQTRPPILYPPMPPAAATPPFRPLHVWGHPTLDHSMLHMCSAEDVLFSQDQPPQRLPLAPVLGIPNFSPPVFNGYHHMREDSNSTVPPVNINAPAQLKHATLDRQKETVNESIDEVLSNPSTPLPIGLKPPSLESLMSELRKKGISIVPPASTCLARYVRRWNGHVWFPRWDIWE